MAWFVPLGLTLLAMGACNPERTGCFTPAGQYVERIVEGLWEEGAAPAVLQMSDRVDVVWHQSWHDPGFGGEGGDGNDRVVVSGAEGVMRGVRVEVENGALVVRDEGRCHGVRDLSLRPQVDIWHPGFAQVWANGQGNFTTADTLHSDYFFYEGNKMAGETTLLLEADSTRILQRAGYGNLTLKGSSRWAGLYLNGYGYFDASGFQVRTALVHHDGLAHFGVRVSNYAFVALRNAGDCAVHGAPDQLDVDDTGAGEVVLTD